MLPNGLPSRQRGAAALLLAILALTAPATLNGVEDEGELLLPGMPRERAITAGETHVYRVAVAEAPLLVTVDQRGFDLVVEAQGPSEQKPLIADAPNGRWGAEVLLLPAGGARERRIEIHSWPGFAAPGSYAIRVEAQSTATQEAARRGAALANMSRAGRLPRETAEARHQALVDYRETLEVWRLLGDRRWEAEALQMIATLELQLVEPQAAADDYQRERALWRDLSMPQREADSLQWLGVARYRSGEFSASREAQEKALALWQSLGDRVGEAGSRSELCLVEQDSGALPAALDCYQEAQKLSRDLGDRSGEANVLNGLGGVYYGLGNPDAAMARYEEALTLRRSLDDRRGQAQTLINIAVAHRALGEWQEALRVYGQVREILAALGDRSQQAFLLNNLGFTYNSLGEPQRALSFLEDALKLRRETDDHRGEVIALNNLGDVWRNLGNLDKALDYHQRALELALVRSDQRQEAVSRQGLAEVELDRGDAGAALRELKPALAALRAAGLSHGELQALYLQGHALARAGRPREALPVLQDVLKRSQALRDRAGEAETLQALAVTERSLGLAREARGHAEAAVARVEELRTGFVSQDLRAAFLATQRRAYALQIDLLMDRHAADREGGYDRAALAVSERGRARSLLDVLYSGNSVRTVSAVPAELLERRRSLRYRLSAKADQQLRQRSGGTERTEAQQREVESLLAELDSVEAEIRRLDPSYAAVAEPPSLGVEDIAKLLDPGTLLLEYSLGENHSYLWAIGAGSLRSFVLPPQREIEALARRFHEELSTPQAGIGRQDAANALSLILLGPMRSDLARYRRLVVVPDGALHLIPFGALRLPGSGRYLLEQLELAYVPSATTLAIQRQRLEHRPPAAKWAAVLADPVFAPDDSRLAGPAVAGRQAPARSRSLERGAPEDAPFSGFERLPASRREAEAISALAPAGQVWTALDLAASREAVLSGQLRDYRTVHFATHGLADTRNPELSGLVLSLVDAAGKPREGFLSLSDIYELDLNADLVVLSGCRTALGREVRGEGIMGLTRGFLYAGVPRVVASLWRVQDRATAELMTRFYRGLWQGHLPAAAALRAAQLSLRRDPRYRDPHSWAGFVLQGDWR